MIDVQAWWNGIGVFTGMVLGVLGLGYGMAGATAKLTGSETWRNWCTGIVVVVAVLLLIGAVAGAFPRWA